MGQLSPRATATGARAPRARVRQQEEPPQREVHLPHEDPEQSKINNK